MFGLKMLFYLLKSSYCHAPKIFTDSFNLILVWCRSFTVTHRFLALSIRKPLFIGYLNGVDLYWGWYTWTLYRILLATSSLAFHFDLSAKGIEAEWFFSLSGPCNNYVSLFRYLINNFSSFNLTSCFCPIHLNGWISLILKGSPFVFVLIYCTIRIICS